MNAPCMAIDKVWYDFMVFATTDKAIGISGTFAVLLPGRSNKGNVRLEGTVAAAV